MNKLSRLQVYADFVDKLGDVRVGKPRIDITIFGFVEQRFALFGTLESEARCQKQRRRMFAVLRLIRLRTYGFGLLFHQKTEL